MFIKVSIWLILPLSDIRYTSACPAIVYMIFIYPTDNHVIPISQAVGLFFFGGDRDYLRKIPGFYMPLLLSINLRQLAGRYRDLYFNRIRCAQDRYGELPGDPTGAAWPPRQQLMFLSFDGYMDICPEQFISA